MSDPVGNRMVLEGGNRLRLAGAHYGDPGNSPVLLLHGGGQTRHSWDSTAKYLAARGFYCVAFDARGHGESDWAVNGDYSLAAYAEDLLCVMAPLRRKAAIIGASLGGLTALMALRRVPEAASSLTLLDIVPFANRAGARRIRTFMLRHSDGFATLDAAASALREFRGEPSRETMEESLKRSLRKGGDERWRWHWDPRILWDEERLADDAADAQLAETALGLDLPILLLRGEFSEIVGEREAAGFLTRVPHARVVVVPGMTHSIVGEEILFANRTILEFISQTKR